MHLTDDKVRIHRKKLPLNSSIFLSAICPAFIIMLLMLSTSCNDRSHPTSQSSIDSALSSFQLPKGFKIEVLAAEPLIGDPVYGRVSHDERVAAAATALGRQALHAHTLAFDHPVTGERLSFTSPLPPDMVAARAALVG
jgi:hypothetical protein